MVGFRVAVDESEDEVGLPNLDDFPPLTSQLSTSAPAVPVWPADVGEGTWALPNQTILPEDSRPRPALPEVRLSKAPPLRLHKQFRSVDKIWTVVVDKHLIHQSKIPWSTYRENAPMQIRRPSLRNDSSLLASSDSRATRNLSSRPSFRDQHDAAAAGPRTDGLGKGMRNGNADSLGGSTSSSSGGALDCIASIATPIRQKQSCSSDQFTVRCMVGDGSLSALV